MFEDKIIQGEGFTMIDSQDYDNLVMFRVMELAEQKRKNRIKKVCTLSFVPLAIMIGAALGQRMVES